MRTVTIPWTIVLLASLALATCAQEAPAAAPAAEAHLGKGYAALKNDRYEEAAGEFRGGTGVGSQARVEGAIPAGGSAIRVT